MKVFVSSTASDLASHRASVQDTLEQLGLEYVALESLVASDIPMAVVRDALATADIFVLLLGHHGSPAQTSGVSWVEAEFHAAQVMSIPILVFIAQPDSPLPEKAVDSDRSRVERFRDELESNYRVVYFSKPYDLASRLTAALRRIITATDDEYDDSVAPLWQSVIDLGASLPSEVWDRVPKDLAANLDQYLYGSSGGNE